MTALKTRIVTLCPPRPDKVRPEVPESRQANAHQVGYKIVESDKGHQGLEGARGYGQADGEPRLNLARPTIEKILLPKVHQLFQR